MRKVSIADIQVGQKYQWKKHLDVESKIIVYRDEKNCFIWGEFLLEEFRAKIILELSMLQLDSAGSQNDSLDALFCTVGAKLH